MLSMSSNMVHVSHNIIMSKMPNIMQNPKFTFFTIYYWPTRGVDSSCVGHYEIKPPIYKKFIEKNKHTRAYGRLENGLMYLY